MIARVWHGLTKPEHADTYESHLKPELLPGLSQKKGFRGSYLLRRAVGDEIEFITIILWESLDDVRAIQAQDYEKAVIPEDRLPLLTRYDARAAHYEVVSTNEPAQYRLGETTRSRVTIARRDRAWSVTPSSASTDSNEVRATLQVER